METNKDISGYSLSREWFDFCFENPDKIKPNHTALYFFIIELCNRLGWKEKFGLPTSMAKEAVGIKSYNTYINTLNDLVEFGFIVMVEKSKNQYTANIVALSKFDKALDRALDKAIIKEEVCSIKKQQSTGESTIQSTGESISSIDKHLNQEPLTAENQKNNIENLFTEKNKLLMPIVDEWFAYKKEIKNPYKTVRSMKAFVKELQKLSNNDPKVAKEITERSMANNWKGIYELNNNGNGKTAITTSRARQKLD